MELNIKTNKSNIDIDSHSVDVNANIYTTDLNIPKNDINLDIQKNNVKLNFGFNRLNSGTTDHSELSNLDFEHSGHTGFQRSGNYVEDDDYNHTDNNYTNEDKNKLDSLENYDDTKIRNTISNLEINKADRTEIPDVSNFVTSTVDNLLNYYLKSETYTKEEVNNLIGQISSLKIERVEQLPTTGRTDTIYLLPATSQEVGNYYEEYLYISNSWELIGTTKVDLTGYATETWVNNQIANFLTQSQIETLINNAISQIEVPTKTSELENDSGYITGFVNVPSTKLSVYANNDEGIKYLRISFMGKNEDFLKLCEEGKVKLYLYKYTRTGKKSWTDTHGNTRENTSIKKWVHPANRYYDVGERPDLQCWGVMSLARTVEGGVEEIKEVIGNADYVVGRGDCGYVVSEYEIGRATISFGHMDIPLNDIMSPIVRVSNNGNSNLLLPMSGDDYTVHIMGARNKPGRAREIQPIRYCLVVDIEDDKHTKYIGDCLNTAQLELFTYRAIYDNHSKHGYDTSYSFLDDVGYGVRII